MNSLVRRPFRFPIVLRFLAKVGLVLAAGLLTTHLVVGAMVSPAPAHPFWSGEAPRVIAHRGGRGLWPENTLYAFRNAAALGVDVIEMDVRRTADGELVVIHDPTVDRTTDGSGAVEAIALAALRGLDAGYRFTADGGTTFPFRGQGIVVPTLAEVFAALPRSRMNLEIKTPGPAMAQPLCDVVRQHGMASRVAVASFDQAAMDTFRSACPEVATSATKDEVVRFVGLSKVFLAPLFAPRAQALQVPERLAGLAIVTPGTVRDARRLNLRIEVWTVNETADMERLVGLPVDGIMTDYPDRLLAALGRRTALAADTR